MDLLLYVAVLGGAMLFLHLLGKGISWGYSRRKL